MKQEELCRKLTEMIAETKAQKLSWRLEVQTTEGNDASEKPIEEEHGTKWTIDECYASYSCNYRGKEFCMITYELLKKSGDKERSSNLVFLPPEGIRFFDLHTLLPYSVEMSAVLADHIHQLWLLSDGAVQGKVPQCGTCGKTRDAYDRRGKPVDWDSLQYTKTCGRLRYVQSPARFLVQGFLDFIQREGAVVL